MPAYMSSSSPAVVCRLDETSGDTAHDASTNARNGVYGSGVTQGADSILPGDPNAAITTANSAYADAPAVTYPGGAGLPSGNANRTFELWFTTTASSGQMIALDGNPSALTLDTIKAHWRAGGIIGEPTDGPLVPTETSADGNSASIGSCEQGATQGQVNKTPSPVNTESGDF